MMSGVAGQEDFMRLSGTAAGVLAFAPAIPPKRRTTEQNYRGFFRRWLEGERFEGAAEVTRRYAEAAVRWGARDRFREAAGRLDVALAAGDGEAAGEAAAEVERLLDVLRAVPAVSRGRRVRPATREVVA